VHAARTVPDAARRRGLARAVRLLALTALAAAGAGCGFQLRGSFELPYRTLYASFPPTSQIEPDFRNQIRVAASTVLVDRPGDAEARLDVLQEFREKEIVAFSTTGQPAQYQLRLRVVFRLCAADGRELIPPTELLLRREVSINPTQIVSKELEDALIYRDMQNEIVLQMLWRLAAAQAPAPAAAAPAAAR